MDVLARWREVVDRPEADVALDEAALLISAAGNPDLDVDAWLRHLDGLGARATALAASGASCAQSACRLLFGELGLAGDRAGYDDPRNSYLDQVLERGLGIPISLSVLLIEVGRRCGATFEPVGLPGHFVVRDPADPDHLIDAFAGGRRLDRAGAERIVTELSGGAGRLTPAMLAPTGTHNVLARMLLNLDLSFERRGDHPALLRVAQLRRNLPGTSLPDRTQLAGRFAGLGRMDLAASVLEEAAGTAPDPATATRLRAQARTLAARLN